MKKNISQQRKPGEGLFALVLLCFSAWLVYESWSISGFSGVDTPGALPMAASTVMLGTVIAVAVGVFRKVKPEPAKLRQRLGQVMPGVLPFFTVLVFAYALSLENVGFFTGSFVFLILSIWFLWRRGLWRAIAVSLFSLAIVYVIFYFGFEVRLPEGLFF